VKIKKAVIAVAGFGTRFLPATKVLPKELMPICEKPVVQYLVEEAVASGVEDVILVTRPGSQGIADHFDSSRELEIHLAEQKKQDLLEAVQALPKLANIAVVRQARHLPYGNGSPLLAARRFLDRDEPFVFMFGDDMVLSDIPCAQQLAEVYGRHRPAAVVGVQEVGLDEVSRYGIVKLKPNSDPPQMESIVEKPKPAEAPSRLAQFGRFVLTPRVVEVLENTPLGKGGELYLTDALARVCREDRVLVHKAEGTWYTMGDPVNFLKATVAYALRHNEIGKPFADYLRGLNLARPG
jgi:UTP--glucose-1-phosphate uridylyltransferase